MIEAGLPGFEVIAWYMMLAPAKTPPRSLRGSTPTSTSASRSRGAQRAWPRRAWRFVGGTPEQADAFLRSEIERWAAGDQAPA